MPTSRSVTSRYTKKQLVPKQFQLNRIETMRSGQANDNGKAKGQRGLMIVGVTVAVRHGTHSYIADYPAADVVQL